MPSVAYRRFWFYTTFSFGGNCLWRDIGASYWGVVWGRRHRAPYPLIAIYIDDGWYESTTNFGLRIGPLDVGMFIDPKHGNDPDWNERQKEKETSEPAPQN
jgi:hypothetical protein